MLYVHGFDIKISNLDLFKKVFKHLKTCGDELGLKLLIISTNLREVTDTHISWGKHEYGAALASVGLSLSAFFKMILIPSGHPYSTVYPTGIHPLLDPLWSNKSTQFMQDGNKADRNQKVAWQLSKNPVALRHLRVCWKNPDNSYNCGKCAKCIRTKINLKLAGALEACKTLDNTIDVELLQELALNDPKEGRMLKEIVNYLEEQHIHPGLKKELMLILENTKEKFSLRKKVKKLDQKYLKSSLRRFSTYLR